MSQDGPENKRQPPNPRNRRASSPTPKITNRYSNPFSRLIAGNEYARVAWKAQAEGGKEAVGDPKIFARKDWKDWRKRRGYDGRKKAGAVGKESKATGWRQKRRDVKVRLDL